MRRNGNHDCILCETLRTTFSEVQENGRGNREYRLLGFWKV